VAEPNSSGRGKTGRVDDPQPSPYTLGEGSETKQAWVGLRDQFKI